MGQDAVAYIIGHYPVLTTTFIDREIEQVREHGTAVHVVALRRPRGPLSPQQESLVEGVQYVLPVPMGALVRSHIGVLASRPLVFLGVLAYLLTRPHPSVRARLKTILHFGEGVHVAYLLRGRGGYRHLHAHFVDRAAVVAFVASRLLGVGYSATAHANDIYVDPVLLPEKLANARFIATCTEYNAAHLAAVTGGRSRDDIACIRHGLDLARYQPDRQSPSEEPPAILAVGQLKEKKGLGHLIEACAILRDRGHHFACRIVGEGPLRPRLEAQIRQLSLQGAVTLTGALTHDEVVNEYRRATVFALPCVTGGDGDRDGIPNVILEAMAMELPVVSTRHSGIPEAVRDGWSGVLVPAGDAPALAAALSELLEDPDGRARMGRRGRQVVAEDFDVAVNAKRLIERFEEVMS